jgi:hypothetical protein
MIYCEPTLDEALSQGDVIEDCPLVYSRIGLPMPYASRPESEA